MSQGQVVDKLYQLHLSPLYLLFIFFVLIIADMLLYDTINGDVCNTLITKKHTQNHRTCCQLSSYWSNTFLLTIFSTLTSLRTVNITPLKLLFSIFTISSLMPLAPIKYPVFVFLTTQWLLAPLITTLLVSHLGLVTGLSWNGLNLTCLIAVFMSNVKTVFLNLSYLLL